MSVQEALEWLEECEYGSEMLEVLDQVEVTDSADY